MSLVARLMAFSLLVLACGRTEPVRPGPTSPTFPCELTVEPRALDFGVLAPGARAAKELVVRNVGDGLCALDALVLGGANDPTFSFEGPSWPRVLGPDESLAMSVTFFAGAPVLPAERKGTLEVRTDDQAEPRVTIELRAKVAFCRLVASPDPLDFGNVTLNTTRTGQVTLTNQGSVDCLASGLRLDAQTDSNFSLPPQPASFTVAPGASTAVSVQFAARTSAPPHLREGHLEFDSNDAVSARGRVALSAFINTICTEAGQYIYTVDNDGRFSRFDPLTLAYVDIAQLRCPTSSSPFSMNLDQSGIAWIIFADAQLFRVDATTGACTATAYQPNQQGFSTYGMGSAFDSRTGVDTLYLAAPDSRLGSLAFPSLTVSAIGSFPLGSSELAGTGDGQLWAFVPPRGASAVLARLDPATARILEQYSLPNITSVGGWAIKFFGGSFYVFIGSDIWRVERRGLDPTRPEPTIAPVRVLVTPGRDIVGAGVSTCAPTQ